jgi:hypothetical protein
MFPTFSTRRSSTGACFDLDVATRESLTSGSLTDDEPWAQLPQTAT